MAHYTLITKHDFTDIHKCTQMHLLCMKKQSPGTRIGREMAEMHFTSENCCPQKSLVTLRNHVFLKKAGLWTVLVVLTIYMCSKSFLQSQRQGLTLPRTLAGCKRIRRCSVQHARGVHGPQSRSCPLRGNAADCTTSNRHCFIFSIQREKREENRDYC